jgi:hypothetical protein
VQVPNVRLLSDEKGVPYMLADYVPGKSLRQILDEGDVTKITKVKKEIQSHFVANCLLGNYDVIGMESDNILIDSKGLPYQIDNGSAFDYSAQGNKKLPQHFTDAVTELDTLRGIENPLNPGTTKLPFFRTAAEIYGNISPAEMIRQINEVVARKEELLKIIRPNLRAKMEARLQSLIAYQIKLKKMGF